MGWGSWPKPGGLNLAYGPPPAVLNSDTVGWAWDSKGVEFWSKVPALSIHAGGAQNEKLEDDCKMLSP